MYKKSLVAIAMALVVPKVNAIELREFMDPNTAFDEAYVGFNATANSGNQDQASYSTFLDGYLQ
jgi:hypothetical protein